MPKLVWYACYGSNLLLNRFLCYIQGGEISGANMVYPGCRDKTPPIMDKQIMIPHELYFSKESSIWENLGVAFIKPIKDKNKMTLGRMYLISSEQFIEVVRQENGLSPLDDRLKIDFENLLQKDSMQIFANWYNTIVNLGSRDDVPIFTFTSNWSETEIELNLPGHNYLKILIKGIKETAGWSDPEVVDYLLKQTGINGNMDKEEISTLVS